MPAAISGHGGHDATFAVARALMHGFALSQEQAWPILLDYNSRCVPPWSVAELNHKLESASKLDRAAKPRGHLW
jgi:putative DNA primase/helicase